MVLFPVSLNHVLEKNKQIYLSEYVGPNLDTTGCLYNLEARRVNISEGIRKPPLSGVRRPERQTHQVSDPTDIRI